MISRRCFLLGSGALLFSRRVSAQQAKPLRIGWLDPGGSSAPAFLAAFLDELRALGYVQDQTFLFEYRTANGRLEVLPVLARELVHLKPDVIVAPSTPAARAVKAATTSIPIVFTAVSDPLGSGLVKSLSHPGGNVTGFTDIGVDLVGKQLDFTKFRLVAVKGAGQIREPDGRLLFYNWGARPGH